MDALFALRGSGGEALFAPALPPDVVVAPPAQDVDAPGALLISTAVLAPGVGVVRAEVRTATVTLRGTAEISPGAGSGNTVSTLQGYAGPRSMARTFVVRPALVQDAALSDNATGAFWNTANPEKPKGVKDPQAVIDVSIDWTPVLDDASDSYSAHVATPTGGLVLAATGHDAGVTTMFLAGGAIGRTATITVQLRSASSPPRVYEQTLYLKIKQL